jgi:hypothetical protein
MALTPREPRQKVLGYPAGHRLGGGVIVYGYSTTAEPGKALSFAVLAPPFVARRIGYDRRQPGRRVVREKPGGAADDEFRHGVLRYLAGDLRITEAQPRSGFREEAKILPVDVHRTR